MKRVTLELGGNDAAVICEDVDIAAVAPEVVTMSFLNSGQICTSIKRVYIHASIYDKFRDAMVAHTKTLAVGDGTGNVFCGPVQNAMQYEKLNGLFDDIEKNKQTVLVGGKGGNSKGFFIQPTIIDSPAEDSRVVTEEAFGESPVFPSDMKTVNKRF